MLLILLFGFFLFLVALLRSGDFSVAAFVGYIDGEFIWLLLRNDGGFIVRGYIIDFVVWVPISFEASLRPGNNFSKRRHTTEPSFRRSSMGGLSNFTWFGSCD